jgi:beta-galactosidase
VKHQIGLRSPVNSYAPDSPASRLVVGLLLVTFSLAVPGLAWAQGQTNAALPPGVKAVWDSAKAYRVTTPTRERLCVNGLWRWQPATEGSREVPAGAWGYYKVPACWPGVQDYLQNDYQTLYAHPSWKDTKLAAVQRAWYERTITIPQDWTGRRISLEVEYLNSYAVVYVEGRQTGELRFPAGRVDLSGVVRPGATHVLSLLVVALPLKAVMESYNDTNTASRRQGRVERRGLCGDVWLTSEPDGARLGTVKIDASFRRSEITFRAGVKQLAAGSRYKLQARITEQGRPVGEFTGPAFAGAEATDGCATFTVSWKPPKLWDIHTPENQYEAQVSLLDAAGRAVDIAAPVRFGFREFWIQGRDFYLNGTRLFLSLVPLDNAQVGAALATYAGARESFLRLKSFGINFVYTHNYGCEPGAHLSFAEILRAADDTGMLVALSQPHFSAYDWKSPSADQTNGYAAHAAFYVQVAGTHPSVVCYAMSHNATGYSEDVNPQMIDGLSDPRDQWAARNAALALRCEAIVRCLDPARIVYHHSSGNLSAMYTLNFYPNFVPVQELDDWFEHWSSVGVKPLLLVEYGAPFGWDWTMYRGWYNGQREFGSAAVPWEYCLAEWNAQFLGDAAYEISDREKRNLRWEAQQFRKGQAWKRWDYPYPVGDARLDEMQPVQAVYTTDNWRAFRTWGLSGNSPWEHDRFWKLRDGFQPRRRDLPVDWGSLQRPGYSPDFIDHTYARFDLAYERSDWSASPAAQSLLRNNQPLLAWIAGKPEHFTTKDHTFYPGETVPKQIIVINNTRLTVSGDASWTCDIRPPVKGNKRVVVPTGDQVRIPLEVKLPDDLAPGDYRISASFPSSTGENQEDSFTFQVMPRPAPPRPAVRIAVFDPPGETTQWLAGRGVAFQPVGADADLSHFDVLLLGKKALTVDGAAPALERVRDGLKVVVFEQTGAVLEKRLGFRIEEYGLRQVWPRGPDSPLLAGLTAEHLRDWRGASTLLPPTLDYTLSPRYNGAPTVRWCGLEVTRLWRCGNWGNVASVLIEKPPRGDFLPIVDGGYALQYSPLLEYREGQGMLLFCQMDVTGRTEPDPAAETLADNILRYVEAWRPAARRSAVYTGEPAGRAWLGACGVEAASFNGAPLQADQVLVVGPGGGPELVPHVAAVTQWIKAGGRVLALGLDQSEANSFLPAPVTMQPAEHIATTFPPFSVQSLLAGVAPADVYNRDPRTLPRVSGGATVYGDGVLASTGNIVFCQLPPFRVSKAMGALSSIEVVEDNTGQGKKNALVSLGSLVSAQFGQKIPAGSAGKTYTLDARVQAVGGPAVLRLEVERAGRPWDRAARGPDTTVNPGAWTDLHLTFAVDKEYPEGWQAYLNASGEGARFQVDRMRLYEGPYISNGNEAGAPSQTPDRNLFQNASFEAGLASWFFTHGPEQFNLRRTFGRTSFAVSRLLANLGVRGSTSLLERFVKPVAASPGPSVLTNGDFSLDANGDGLADRWECSVKGGSCTRQALAGAGSGWAQVIDVPPVAAGNKPPEVMMAQHDFPIRGAQWYRLSLRTRAEGLSVNDVTWTVQNTANWQALFDYINFAPKAEWQSLSFLVQAKDTVAKGTKFQIWFTGTGKLWLADVRLEPVQDPTAGRCREGLYLTRPTEWDDPYRFFGW